MAEFEASCKTVALNSGSAGKQKILDTQHRLDVLKRSMNKFAERRSLKGILYRGDAELVAVGSKLVTGFAYII